MKPILIVEDEAIMRESLRDWLTDEGYPVETAEHGEAALKAIGERDFSLLILDMELPGKSGLEVLKEAKARKPQLNGIIITAYPSIESAVEAMRIGAVDYLPKPFSLDVLGELIQKTIGLIQVEIKPKVTPEEAIAQPPVGEAKIEEVIAIAPEEIPVHLKQGKTHFEAGRYTEALREFESILSIAPGNIETRVWMRKTKQALAEPKVGVVAEEAKPEECVWMKMGLVDYQLCTRNYDCLGCEFDQMMQEKIATGKAPELDQALERFKELPGSRRLCRYALKGDISYRVCTQLFQCTTCEFAQMLEDAVQQKLASRLGSIRVLGLVTKLN